MANAKEAQARIKINQLFESAGWRFFDDSLFKDEVQALIRVLSRKRRAVPSFLDPLGGPDAEAAGLGVLRTKAEE